MTPNQRHKIQAACYLWVLSLVLWVKYAKEESIVPHARQGAVLTLLSIVVLFIPLKLIVIAVELVIFASMVLGFIRASQGHMFVLPGLGQWTQEKGAHVEKTVSQGIQQLKDKGVQEIFLDTLKDEETDNMAFFAYIPFLTLILLEKRKDDPVIQFHCRQALVIQVIGIFIAFLPVWGTMAVILAVSALSILGMLFVLQGQRQGLPFLGWFVQKFPNVDMLWVTIRGSIKHLLYLSKNFIQKQVPKPLSQFVEEEKTMYTLFAKKTADLYKISTEERRPGVLAYVVGPVIALLYREHSSVVFHSLQGTLLLLCVGIGVFLGNAAILCGAVLMLFWALIRTADGKETILPFFSWAATQLLPFLTPAQNGRAKENRS